MASALVAALSLAASGFPVFPCLLNKSPALANGHGFHDASTDPDEVRAMFGRGGELAGVPTGGISGFDVLDVDYQHDGKMWEDANEHRLPETRIHRTQSGGRHYLFRHAPGVRNSAGRIAAGIDVRGDGGYIVAPPSDGYSIVSDAEIAEWPDWLLEQVLARPEPPKVNGYHPPIALDDRRIDGLVRSIQGRLRGAQEGAKHFQLRNAALSMGGIQERAGLSDAQASGLLLAALPATVKDWKNASATIAWGLERGRARPIELDDRSEYQPRKPTEPPAYISDVGMDDLEARVAEEIRRGEPIIEPAAETYSESLWVIREAWMEAEIPRRPWIARGYLMRGSITVVSGASAAGKSSLMVGWATALTVDCAFRNLRAPAAMRVATYNVEDDEFEQKRRFSAMLNRMKLAPDAFQQRLAILGPRGVGTLLTVGRDGGVALNTAVMDELETFVGEYRPDVLMLDPFVELHGAEENDNTAVRLVMARFRQMANDYKMAVVILHHSRKGGGDPGDLDSLRGASSIVGAARIVLTISVMSKEEAQGFGITEKNRRNYFRLDGAKSNYSPPEDAEWFQREEITLGNGDGDEPADKVAVAWPWKPPSVWAEISTPAIHEALAVLAEPPAGWLYTAQRRGKDQRRWAGRILIEKLGITEEQAKRMITDWLNSGLLYEEDYFDESQRKSRSGIRVDLSKRPDL